MDGREKGERFLLKPIDNVRLRRASNDPGSLNVNGITNTLDVLPQRTLVEVLRESLGLTGTKKSCNEGEYGACKVLMDGKPVASCLLLAIDAQGKEIVTIEGLSEGEKLHPIQESFLRNGGIQCGFCTPGMVMGRPRHFWMSIRSHTR